MYNVAENVKMKFASTETKKRGFIKALPKFGFGSDIIIDETMLKSFEILDEVYTPKQGIVGSVIAKEIHIEFFEDMPDELTFPFERLYEAYIGVEDENGVDYIPCGQFILEKPTKSSETSKRKFVGKDAMIKLNVPYKDEENIPRTLSEMLNIIIKITGVPMEYGNLPNLDFTVEKNPFVKNETCRDVLRAICQVTCSYARVNRVGTIILKVPDRKSTETRILEYSGTNLILNRDFNSVKTIVEVKDIQDKTLGNPAPDNYIPIESYFENFDISIEPSKTVNTVLLGWNYLKGMDKYIIVPNLKTGGTKRSIEVKSVQLRLSSTFELELSEEHQLPNSVLVVYKNEPTTKPLSKCYCSHLTYNKNLLTEDVNGIFVDKNGFVYLRLLKSELKTPDLSGIDNFLMEQSNLSHELTILLEMKDESIYTVAIDNDEFPPDVPVPPLKLIKGENIVTSGNANTVVTVSEAVEVESEHRKFDKHKYFTMKTTTGPEVGPINRVVLKYSAIEGQPTIREDEEDVKTNGVKEFAILDNPFAFSEEKRKKLIDGIWIFMKGLKYCSFDMAYMPVPYLDAGDGIDIIDVDGTKHFSIIGKNKLTYNGVIKQSSSLTAESVNETKYAYNAPLKESYKRAEIMVDKANNKITSIIEEQEDTKGRVSKIEQTIDSLNLDFQKIGGSNLIKNSAMKADTKYWLGNLNIKYTEENRPPENISNGEYWICTEDFENYKKGKVYRYNSGDKYINLNPNDISGFKVPAENTETTYSKDGLGDADLVTTFGKVSTELSWERGDWHSDFPKPNTKLRFKIDKVSFVNPADTWFRVYVDNGAGSERVLNQDLSANTTVNYALDITDTTKYVYIAFRTSGDSTVPNKLTVENLRIENIIPGSKGFFEETNLTKKDLMATQNLLQYTESFENETTRSTTVSKRLIRQYMPEDFSLIHNFVATNEITIPEGQEQIFLSFKLRNELKTGVLQIGVAYLNDDIQNMDLVKNVYSMKEDMIVLTPDDVKDFTSIKIKSKIPRKEEVFPVTVSLFEPEDKKVRWLDLGDRLVKEYKDTEWVIIKEKTTCYDVETNHIYTFRPFINAYYDTQVLFENYAIKNAIILFTIYPSFNLVKTDFEPYEPLPKGFYYGDINTSIFRAKYVKDEDGKDVFDKYEDTFIPGSIVFNNPLPVPLYPSEYAVPAIGQMEYGDVMATFSGVEMEWAPYPEEIYGKNFRADEEGLKITSGENVMYIDEDEILAKYNDANVFRVSGDSSLFKNVLTTKIEFVDEETIASYPKRTGEKDYTIEKRNNILIIY